MISVLASLMATARHLRRNCEVPLLNPGNTSSQVEFLSVGFLIQIDQLGGRHDAVAGNEAHSGFIAKIADDIQGIAGYIAVNGLDGENHLFASRAVIESEQIFVVGVQLIAVIIGLVVYDFFKIGNGF